MCGSTELERPLENGSATPPGSIPGNGPASFVAAEIHLGRQAGWRLRQPTALQHSSCVPALVVRNILLFQLFE
jgi:hypothetical protein